MLVEETLKDLGYEVCGIASTEAEAVLQAKKHHPDLMIVDAGLRIGCGVSAVATISKKQRIPYIFITGNAQKVQSLDHDAIILEKPFFMPDLVSAIEQALAISTDT